MHRDLEIKKLTDEIEKLTDENERLQTNLTSLEMEFDKSEDNRVFFFRSFENEKKKYDNLKRLKNQGADSNAMVELVERNAYLCRAKEELSDKNYSQTKIIKTYEKIISKKNPKLPIKRRFFSRLFNIC